MLLHNNRQEQVSDWFLNVIEFRPFSKLGMLYSIISFNTLENSLFLFFFVQCLWIKLWILICLIKYFTSLYLADFLFWKNKIYYLSLHICCLAIVETIFIPYWNWKLRKRIKSRSYDGTYGNLNYVGIISQFSYYKIHFFGQSNGPPTSAWRGSFYLYRWW